MDSDVLSRRRGPLVIAVSIIKATRNGNGKTDILYSVGLSYSQLTKYLNFLTARGFVEKNSSQYKPTDKGIKLIEEYESSPLTQCVVAT